MLQHTQSEGSCRPSAIALARRRVATGGRGSDTVGAFKKERTAERGHVILLGGLGCWSIGTQVLVCVGVVLRPVNLHVCACGDGSCSSKVQNARGVVPLRRNRSSWPPRRQFPEGHERLIHAGLFGRSTILLTPGCLNPDTPPHLPSGGGALVSNRAPRPRAAIAHTCNEATCDLPGPEPRQHLRGRPARGGPYDVSWSCKSGELVGRTKQLCQLVTQAGRQQLHRVTRSPFQTVTSQSAMSKTCRCSTA